MNWEEIKVAENGKSYTYRGKPVFGNAFEEALSFHAPGLAAVADGTGAYHIDHNGDAIYAKRFQRTFGFYFNRAAVVDMGNWYHIDPSGASAYPQRFDWVGNFQEQLCVVRSTGHYYHIDLHGQRPYDFTWAYCGDFRDGIACAKIPNGKFRHIRTNGEFLHPQEFEDLGVFHKGYATARDQQGWHHIDKNGRPLYEQRYLMVEPFYNGFALVTQFNFAKCILAEDGRVVMTVDG